LHACFAQVREEPAQQAGDTQQNTQTLRFGVIKTCARGVRDSRVRHVLAAICKFIYRSGRNLFTIKHRAQAIGTRFFYGRCQSKCSVF
jgi:hypothetical protein